ncbi:glycosyltransferase family 4 protein [Adhaeribacter soli]|uniref:Glycosyltransferase family 4 protein n=1 Tax=Adhaeribacter soli TaxID=2607655 RepID=A0A5N1J9X9_9BACT|nr:glycosyltransferase family 1 protein [Adhaeribacter soli]KAA9345639.1 glycosyltransferase family 4 protein [Adhaeribacter soli]
MVVNHPEAEFYFFFDRPYDNQFIFGPNVTPVVLNPPARHPFLFYIWFEISVAKALARIKPDVFLSTDGLTTLKTAVPKVTVMHDLAFEHYPQDIDFIFRKYLQYFSPKFARRSERIIAVSEFTRQDIVKTYGIEAKKIDVVYNDASAFFAPSPEAEQENTRNKFSKGKPYFIFVGAIHPRKNLVHLFKAFDSFKQQTGSEAKLLIVGRKAWNSKDISNTFERMKFQEDVVFTGRVTDEELRQLYGAGLANVYVPTLEGFGIPIVEAQKCNCPVITSNISSMPEVGGEAVLLVDPFNVGEIAGTMKKITEDAALRQTLIYLGRQNLKRFSWERSAGQLWDSLMLATESTRKPA